MATPKTPKELLDELLKDCRRRAIAVSPRQAQLQMIPPSGWKNAPR